MAVVAQATADSYDEAIYALAVQVDRGPRPLRELVEATGRRPLPETGMTPLAAPLKTSPVPVSEAAVRRQAVASFTVVKSVTSVRGTSLIRWSISLHTHNLVASAGTSTTCPSTVVSTALNV